VVRSRDLISKSYVKVVNKTANIDFKNLTVKNRCKGDTSNIENGANRLRKDARQNALAVVTNLGHVTPF